MNGEERIEREMDEEEQAARRREQVTLEEKEKIAESKRQESVDEKEKYEASMRKIKEKGESINDELSANIKRVVASIDSLPINRKRRPVTVNTGSQASFASYSGNQTPTSSSPYETPAMPYLQEKLKQEQEQQEAEQQEAIQNNEI